MFHLIRKSFIHHRSIYSNAIQSRFIRATSSHKSISTATDPQTLTVSYLTNSCGLSLESAVEASKKVKIVSLERPESVLELFRTHGFTKKHIASLVSKHPPIILADAEKILKPKIEFLESLGITGPDLPRIVCSNKGVLLTSLKNGIIPAIDFLKGFVETNEKLINAIKQSSRVFRSNIQKQMEPNITTLRAYGVPETHIAKLIVLQPKSLMLSTDLFEEIASAVRKMDFNPMSRSFILAIRSMTIISKANWEKKKRVFLSFGWSEDEFHSAFKVQPMCMLSSEKKIRELMEFFVNKLGLKPLDIAKCPNLFLISLERRIIPRCSIMQVLMSKGLIKKNIDIVWVLNSNKEKFEKKFVTQFKLIAPEVMKAYQGKMSFEGFNNDGTERREQREKVWVLNSDMDKFK